MRKPPQRYWDDVSEGDELAPVAFPLTVFRLVLAAGATRDMSPMHHNTEIARAAGAPDIFANAIFLMGMWERTVREFIGLAGTIRRIDDFRMRGLNSAGDVVDVQGTVVRKWLEDDAGLIEIEVRSKNRDVVTVGPGRVTVTIPRRDSTNEKPAA